MSHLIGGADELGWVALKALLLYLTAIIGFRIGERRTLAEMSPFDFVAAVAVGAVIGRVPNSNSTTYFAGTVTLVTIILAHWIISRLRYFHSFAQLIDHSPRLLVVHGRVLDRELRRSGLTLSDLYGVLRQHGVKDLGEIRYVIFEQRGKISVIRQTEHGDHELGLVQDILERTPLRV